MPTFDPSTGTGVWVLGVDAAFFDHFRLLVFALVVGVGILIFAVTTGSTAVALRR